MAAPVCIVTTLGTPITLTDLGTPMTPTSAGQPATPGNLGRPVVIVSALGLPVRLTNEDGTAYTVVE